MFVYGFFENMVTRGQRNVTDAEAITCALGAGAVSATLYGPVEMTAIHQQKTGLNLTSTISHLVKNHGVASIWRGVVPTAWREAIYTAGYLGLAPVFTSKLMRQPGWETSFYTSAVVGSCMAGVLANLASQPIDTAKTVVQADVAGTSYTGMLQALPKRACQGGDNRPAAAMRDAASSPLV
jgi:solute carrier family 25 2-oxodicarboxylate transporter 21